MLLLFFEEEDGVGAAECIETPQGGGRIEVCHHLRCTYLVEEVVRFLGDDEGVRHQAGAFCLAVADQDEEAVGYFERGRKFVTDKKLLADFDSYLGDLYHDLGDKQKALEAFKRVQNFNPEDQETLDKIKALEDE